MAHDSSQEPFFVKNKQYNSSKPLSEQHNYRTFILRDILSTIYSLFVGTFKTEEKSQKSKISKYLLRPELGLAYCRVPR